MNRVAKLFFVVVCCLCFQISLSATSYTDAEYQDAFTSWMHDFSVSYDADEFQTRYSIFQANMDFVQTFNARGGHQVGLNRFAALSNAEFRAVYLPGLTRPSTRDVSVPEFSGEGMRVSRATSVDWRTSGAVTPIKDQGQCGSCWTFGSAGAIESTYKISTGTLVSLSEQNLLDCVTDSDGCSGGSPYYAFQYVVNNGGIDTEVGYPYTGTQATCAYSSTNKGADITAFSSVTATEAALQAAVTNQPCVVAIDAGLESFQLYASGIYNDSACLSDANDLDHAVVVVGFGTNSSGDYWIIKNSWGTTWGVAGYFYLARNAGNRCGVATNAYFPTRTSTSAATTAKSTTTATATTAKSTTTAAATTAKSTTSTTTTGKAATTAASSTTAKSTTTSGSTTGSSTTAYIYQDSLSTGWTITYSGTVSSISTCGTADSGSCGVSAVIGTSGQLIFSASSALSTSGHTNLYFSIKASVAGTYYVTFTTSYVVSIPVTTTWASYYVPLSSVGSPTSISSLSFQNEETAANTLYLDTIYLG